MKNVLREAGFLLAASALLSAINPPVGRAAGEDELSRVAEALLKSAGRARGLLVHWGCGDGALTLRVGQKGQFLVQGLEQEEALIRQARQRIRAENLYGVISIEETDFGSLPYVDNLVTVLVIDDFDRLQAKGADRQGAPEGAYQGL